MSKGHKAEPGFLKKFLKEYWSRDDHPKKNKILYRAIRGSERNAAKKIVNHEFEKFDPENDQDEERWIQFMKEKRELDDQSE